MKIKNTLSIFLSKIFSYVDRISWLIFYKYKYFKVNELENKVKINLDSLYLYYFSLLSFLKKNGVCCEKKITGSCEPHLNTSNNIENVEEAYTSVYLESGEIVKENISEDKVKIGQYVMDVKNLIKDRDYILTITPLIDMVSSEKFDGTAGTKYAKDESDNYKFVPIGEGLTNDDYQNTISSLSGLTNTVKRSKTPLPVNKDLTYFYSPPYLTNKNSTSLRISIVEDNSDYSCANLLSEYCEIGSIQGSLFYYNETYYYNLTDKSGQLNLNHIYGGKGFSSNQFFIKFRTSNSDKIKIRISVGRIEEISNNTNIYESCLREITFRVEPAAQAKEINNTSTKDININNPEIEYGDGGERYYEPWKFWIEGDLKSDANGNPSWYKKWKSWFKEKIKIHNKWIDNPNRTDIEDDIDAFKEDPNYKQDHL